jgi:MerR family regulatory protein
MAEAVHIGQAAKQAGMSVDTIRFYQKVGLIAATLRSTGGYRLIAVVRFVTSNSCATLKNLASPSLKFDKLEHMNGANGKQHAQRNCPSPDRTLE